MPRERLGQRGAGAKSCEAKVTSDGSTCMGPRYLDPYTPDELGTGSEADRTGGQIEERAVDPDVGRPDLVDELCALTHGTDGLDFVGLMAIPPVDEDPAGHFALLAEMAARNGLEGLSMGMSDDFETAIAHGATHVRIGSALFGTRQPGPVPGR